jgi:succinate dehydrogenase/fumarate reductase cytochrome b subunit
MQLCPPSYRKRKSEILFSAKCKSRSPESRHISTSASGLCQNTEICHRMKRLIIADLSPRQFRYLVAALVLSVVYTLMTSSSLKNSRQYGVGLSFIVMFCFVVWLLTHFFRTYLSVLIAWIGFSAFPVIRQSFTRDSPSIKARLATLVVSSVLVTVMAIVVYFALILHNS